MKQLNSFLFFTLLFLGIEAYTQQSIPTSDTSYFLLQHTIPFAAKNMQTDRLGNIYVVSNTNQLYKYNADGKLLSTLNYKYLGNITHIDATNPLEIYVFYKELNLVVFLDNNLAYRGEIKLTDFGIGQAATIARSFDNGIWVFDLVDLQLKKMDKDGSNTQSSGNVRQYVSQVGNITAMYDNDDRLFLTDTINGVLLFDIFASYIKTLPIKGAFEVKVIGDMIFYRSGNLLKKYQPTLFKTTEYALPYNGEIIKISIEKNRLYILTNNEIHIYRF